MKIKDLFRHRYAVVFEVIVTPHLDMVNGHLTSIPRYSCAVVRRPYKRPLCMSYNEFYNTLSKTGCVVTGSYKTIKNLGGVTHDLNDCIILGDEPDAL